MSTMTGDVGKLEFGPCQVTFNGVDLGYTKGGVTVEYSQTFLDVEVDQSTMLADIRLQSERVMATVPMAQTDIDSLISASHSTMPAGTRTAQSTKRKIDIGGTAVDYNDAKELIITPLSDGAGTLSSDANNKVTIYKAFPKIQWQKAYNLGDIRIITVEFHGLMDTSKATGVQLFTIGDTTAT